MYATDAHRERSPVLLTSCRDCSSKLLQLEEMWLQPDGQHVARRRCPECHRVDTVTANPLALWAWRRQSERERGELVRGLLEVIEDEVSWESVNDRAELEAACVRDIRLLARLRDDREQL
jgi:hypothetical protein